MGTAHGFVELLESLGHRIIIGDATGIRRAAKRRQKNDRRDAALILDLVLKDEFSQVHRPSFESREVPRLLRDRHKLVQLRTRAKNSLPALAGERRLDRHIKAVESKGARDVIAVADEGAMARRREEWLSLVDELNSRSKSLDSWLEQQV